VLLLGSHIDTVRDAGKYDGNFGVLAAIAAVSNIGPLPYNIEIIAFGDEEGVRFPATLAGSRAIAGSFNPATLALQDADGISLGEALQSFGCDPAEIAAIARPKSRIAAYVELHIEQGPVLEAENLALGIVTAINGAARFMVTVTGSAGHAGTVPMALRADALAASAEMVLAVETRARQTPDLVATVGSLTVQPGAPNSVPGEVRFSIDVRAPQDAPRHAAIADIEAHLRAIADRRSVTLQSAKTHDAPATPCAPWLQAQLADAVNATGMRPFHLPSGAGHDAMAVAALCPVGMLFVRCKNGISHTPAESITTADAGIAVAALTSFLRHFKPVP
jgi:allantoate deiminase